jgi:hypothetical protein
VEPIIESSYIGGPNIRLYNVYVQCLSAIFLATYSIKRMMDLDTATIKKEAERIAGKLGLKSSKCCWSNSRRCSISMSELSIIQ